ncbi:hypothetical protein SAMN05446037_100645 [Anaerovirgula multivorans]|uniref:Uncharacterized protein n=1 Tax=Anaerovirgula multivorans TaxID=312168 RepID=A0A239CMN5_9FIRM|nr:hypothetical protein [Anaerovirgula multivorans]SNS21199.1 hypothetical protein SAMN05446037_100645 [Anaerovirgula multivorans]
MAYVGKGLSAIKEANEGGVAYLKLKDGESTEIRIITPLDEIMSVYEHAEQIDGRWKNFTCLGKDRCPACKMGKNASFKSFIVVYDRKDDKTKIFKASKTVGTALLALVEEYGDITKRDLKIKREGEKLNTKYHFFARDIKAFDSSTLELPDVDEIVAPKTPEELMTLLNSGARDIDVESDVAESDDYMF